MPANKPTFSGVAGATLYAILRDDSGDAWDDAGGDIVPYAVADWADYAVALSVPDAAVGGARAGVVAKLLG